MLGTAAGKMSALAKSLWTDRQLMQLHLFRQMLHFTKTMFYRALQHAYHVRVNALQLFPSQILARTCRVAAPAAWFREHIAALEM